MMEILQFIFSSFWIWLGTVVLVWAASAAAITALTAIVSTIRR